MADTGWVIATSYNNVAGAGTDWVSQTAMLTPAGTTDYLACTGFGLTLASGQVFQGIEVKIGHQKSFGTGNLRDKEIRLWQPTVGLTATDKAVTGSDWPGSMTDATYGGASDLWDVGWTYSQLNDSSFGVYIKANEAFGAGAATAVVGDVYVKVTYIEVGSDEFTAWIASMIANLMAGSQVASGNVSGGIGIHTGRSRSRHTPIGY